MALLDVLTHLNIADEEEFPEDLVVEENTAYTKVKLALEMKLKLGTKLLKLMLKLKMKL